LPTEKAFTILREGFFVLSSLPGIIGEACNPEFQMLIERSEKLFL